MINKFLRRGGLAGLAVLSLGVGVAHASTTQLEITITNNQGEGGVFLTPLYIAFHDGGFDAFNEGEVASRGLELLAEDGIFSPMNPESIASERIAASAPGSQGAGLFGTEGFGSVGMQPPLIDTGETTSVTLDVNGGQNRFFNYLSMILPSNDNFIGNDDAIELFDVDGNFLGDRTIEVLATDVWDAGTEVNNGVGLPFGVAANANPLATESDQNGLVSRQGDLSFLENFGFTNGAGFFVDNIGDSIATITVREVVSEVPLPAGAPLILTGLGVFGWMRSRKNKSA